MTLTEFIKSHDKAILAIDRLRNLLGDEGFIGALDFVADIENHMKQADFEYLDWMQYLATEEENE
ncbi:hypothetical protein ACVR1N_04925 [Streptococcus constellatus subsp. pharyngis]|uniref:Uncharacterized protein n=1 Tax=Streptococcus constellatus subsp. pharyngis SK1060 = CCUG 46377 TaxID=1035184 RepID=F9P6Z6_STRCV|nr:hypothetical protein [Streptococcus constellatus]QBX07041.1 hypothetical protein JavanS103_0017 [Streptococcus satellite phage Javan103]QBX07063.1 hypothetical protein JavanS106_0017 [Streptococcus satellite phage Javan106]QBX07086.1 hypothetical protein JavanS109_0017 [Streptococcus satellite phage Javan109]AGU73217.1 hypothetical protein SCRE_1397 [Streptococcus constellatus subsp. pharyngis C232]AGU74971.1 hypothetical protein SCR2_1397 [Streptococcus constellatus subsp. pharyngis C818]